MKRTVNNEVLYAYTGGKDYNPDLPTMVFIHGVLNDHSVWALQSRFFANHGFNVLAVDQPGHGRSTGAPPASVAEAAARVSALLDDLQVREAVLVGLSWGFLLGGVLLYALRGHRPVQLGVWALNALLWDLVLPFAMFHAQADFVWTQMFTDYYEWFGVGAVVLMLLYNGQRGSGHKQLFYWFYPAHIYLLYGASCLLYNVMR